jgi:hypothetical protein
MHHLCDRGDELAARWSIAVLRSIPWEFRVQPAIRFGKVREGKLLVIEHRGWRHA